MHNDSSGDRLMNTYNIKYTDTGKGTISVPEYSINDSLDTPFPGRIRLEWGEEINESFLNLLENFSCPEDSGAPDLSVTSDDKLLNPVQGQLWYNSSDGRLYSYNGLGQWTPYILSTNDYAANRGQINHGEVIPRPISNDGYIFEYHECIWSVSAAMYDTTFDLMTCTSDPNTAQVTMTYRSSSSGVIINGTANYLIVGIRSNVNNYYDATC